MKKIFKLKSTDPKIKCFLMKKNNSWYSWKTRRGSFAMVKRNGDYKYTLYDHLEKRWIDFSNSL